LEAVAYLYAADRKRSAGHSSLRKVGQIELNDKTWRNLIVGASGNA
jgi:hypothetical protein